VTSMLYLVRTIENREGASFEYRDNEYTGDEINIGRATDQAIQLTEPEVALEHAVIQLRGDSLGTIKSVSPSATVFVNDQITRSSRLRPGDTVRIGESVLEVISAPSGFDFAVTLERGQDRVDEADSPPGSQYVTELAATGLRKRLWSWVLFVLIVVGFFVVPVSGLFDQRVQAFLRATPLLPDDSVWATGPLHWAHGMPGVARDCNVCHVKPFVPVSDEACTACHDGVGRHADAEQADG